MIESHSPDTAAQLAAADGQDLRSALLVLLVTGLGLNVSNIINLIGTGGLAAALLFLVGSFVIGFVLGGPRPGRAQRDGLGTGSAQVRRSCRHGARTSPAPRRCRSCWSRPSSAC